ncbi:Proton-coupled amino acid transporter 4 [Smittium mucronatum]|uniref:Proton-coupled amino acid transporter 4 n=1 Tax=Smittium mucronatum TaxID=133383 RepID=A0A1R0H434_9FUNG|nr:Proton-coupled amino acid transporter 4 [Smittium mucronatum]
MNQQSSLVAAGDSIEHSYGATEGTLQLPAALKEGGWAGVFYILLSGIISNYTGILTVRALYHREGLRVKTFSDLGHSAYGLTGLRFVKYFKHLALISAGAIFILLAAINLDALSNSYFGFQDHIQLWVVISSIIVFIPMVLFKEAHESPVMSFFGTFTTVFVIVIVSVLSVIRYFSKDFISPPTTLFKFFGFPVSISSIFFAFGGNLLWPEVEKGMKNPKDFDKVLTLSNACVTLLYMSIAISAYLIFGNNVLSPVLLSFQSSPILDTAYILITLHVLLTAPILLMSVTNEMEHDMCKNSSDSQEFSIFGRSVFRGLIITASSATVLVLPNFEKLVAFMGAISSSILCLVSFYFFCLNQFL